MDPAGGGSALHDRRTDLGRALRDVLATLVAVALIVASIGCRAELEFADWTIPAAEGTPVIEYAHVPAEERSESIEMVEDLVIGGGETDDPRYAFYNPRGLAVDDAGNIYVAEAGDHHVRVYDSDGTFVLSFGREGQGPGEFDGPGGVEVAGGRVAVIDSDRLSHWSLEGEYIGEVTARRSMPFFTAGLDDGSLVVRHPSFDDQAQQMSVIARWDAEAMEVERFAVLPDPPTVWYPSRDAEGGIALSIAPAIPQFAASADGRVYLSGADRYQVLALEAGGDPVWALRTNYVPPPVSRFEIERGLENIRRRFPGATEAEVDWPESEPALTGMWVDGHGHLYVFLYSASEMGPQRKLVDVYSPGGERLFTGTMLSPIWLWAERFHLRGDYVYDFGRDPDSGEDTVVRYRLIEPF